MKLSEKIIRLRKGRGLSQEELAERLGVSPQGMEHRPQHLAVPVGQQFDRPQLEVLCAEV